MRWVTREEGKGGERREGVRLVTREEGGGREGREGGGRGGN